MMEHILSACPFCGYEEPVIDGKSEDVRVRCEDCGVVGRAYYFQSEDDAEDAEAKAIAAWNRRTPPDTPPLQRVELTDAEIEQGWRATFSTGNPFCPCDLKSFTKAVRWTERRALLSQQAALDTGSKT